MVIRWLTDDDSRPKKAIAHALRPAPPWLPERIVLLTRTGSHAYGTATAGSDEDFRGVAVAPRDSYMGFSKSFERFAFEGDTEGEIEDLRVFLRAACNGEPQVLAPLFCAPCDVLVATETGCAIRGAQRRFLSKRMVKPFAGHARRIVTRAAKVGSVSPKEAATAVRLVRMIAEILIGEKVCIARHDADELLAIRNLERSTQDALREAADGLAHVDAWMAASLLPEQPDREYLNALCAWEIERMNRGKP